MNISKIKSLIVLISILLSITITYGVFADVQEASEKQFLMDSDQDGLSDSEELAYGTNPKKEDTDDDGYRDGVEVKSGYDPLKPAPGDRITSQRSTEATTEAENLTTKLSESIRPLLPSSADETKKITATDIDSALRSSFEDALFEEGYTFNTLAEFDIQSDKLIDQTYAGLSSEERSVKIAKDTELYLQNIAYILTNNRPDEIQQPSDIEPFLKSLGTHLRDLTLSKPNYSFYKPLESKIENIVAEAALVDVPQNMAVVHIYGIRIFKTYLELGKQAPENSNDPLSQLLFLKKVQSLSQLSFQYFVQSYDKISADIAPLGDK